jgi:hypothetical protein
MPLIHLCNIYDEVGLGSKSLIEQLMKRYIVAAFEKNMLDIVLNSKKYLPIFLNQYANI